MNVRRKRWLRDSADAIHPGMPVYDNRYGGIWFECEVMDPPSMAGRTVHLFVGDDEVPLLLRELRDQAIRVRSRPLEGG